MFIPNAYVRGFRAFVQKATMDEKRNGEGEEKNDESNKIHNRGLRNHENTQELEPYCGIDENLFLEKSVRSRIAFVNIQNQ